MKDSHVNSKLNGKGAWKRLDIKVRAFRRKVRAKLAFVGKGTKFYSKLPPKKFGLKISDLPSKNCLLNVKVLLNLIGLLDNVSSFSVWNSL